MEFAFVADLWRHRDGSWHFVTLPHAVADEVADLAGSGRGFGSVPVRVTVGSTKWSTSLFPDRSSASYVLPMKRDVRVAEGLDEGEPVEVTIVVDPTDGAATS